MLVGVVRIEIEPYAWSLNLDDLHLATIRHRGTRSMQSVDF
jgi:hypothetical protein